MSVVAVSSQPPGGAGARRAEKPGRVRAREPPVKRLRNWALRAAVRPRASCGSGSPKDGDAGLLLQSWGRRKSLGNGGKIQEKGRTEIRGPLRPWKPLEALRLPPATRISARPRRPGLGTACGVSGPRELPAATPPRSPGSGPPSRKRSALLLCQEHPRRPGHARRGRGEGRRSVRYPVPQHWALRSREGRKGQRAPYRHQRGEVSSSRGVAPVREPLSSSRVAECNQVQALPPGMPAAAAERCCFRTFSQAGRRGPAGRGATPQLGTRQEGVCPGRARPRRLRGKFS
nr:uncharacterized protein LOC105729406 [Aotus nancymaae]